MQIIVYLVIIIFFAYSAGSTVVRYFFGDPKEYEEYEISRKSNDIKEKINSSKDTWNDFNKKFIYLESRKNNVLQSLRGKN